MAPHGRGVVPSNESWWAAAMQFWTVPMSHVCHVWHEDHTVVDWVDYFGHGDLNFAQLRILQLLYYVQEYQINGADACFYFFCANAT